MKANQVQITVGFSIKNPCIFATAEEERNSPNQAGRLKIARAVQRFGATRQRYGVPTAYLDPHEGLSNEDLDHLDERLVLWFEKQQKTIHLDPNRCEAHVLALMAEFFPDGASAQRIKGAWTYVDGTGVVEESLTVTVVQPSLDDLDAPDTGLCPKIENFAHKLNMTFRQEAVLIRRSTVDMDFVTFGQSVNQTKLETK